MSDPGSYIQPRGPDLSPTLVPSIVNGSSAVGVCNRIITLSDYDITILVVCLIALLIGLVYTFFGYRLYRIVLFLTGFIFGSTVIYLVCQREDLMSTLANAGVAVGGGLLFGLITVLVEYVGVFMTGFLSGLFLGTGFMVVLEETVPPQSFWTTISVLFVCGLVLSLVTLRWERFFMVFGTGLMGGALVMAGLDYFIYHFGTVRWLWDVLNIRHPPVTSLCWYGWLLLALWPSLCLIGCVIQLKLTVPPPIQRKTHKSNRNNQQRHVVRRLSSSEQRLTNVGQTQSTPPAPTRPLPAIPHQTRTFRQLYQDRRKHGDVICQSYLQSLQGIESATSTVASGARLT